MIADFFRFPQTPHIAWLGRGEPRDDKLLSNEQATELLAADVVVEEKLDGANLGFSLAPDGTLRTQNRGQYLHQPFSGQFARLPVWLTLHGEGLLSVLHSFADRELMLFGEWCAARHSLDYDCLPDWFLLFDVYDRAAQKFWSSQRRNDLAQVAGLIVVPTVVRGRRSIGLLKDVLATQSSRFRQGPLDGLVVRGESVDWCESRAKLVRADFTQNIAEHWMRRRVEWNRVQTHESTHIQLLRRNWPRG